MNKTLAATCSPMSPVLEAEVLETRPGVEGRGRANGGDGKPWALAPTALSLGSTKSDPNSNLLEGWLVGLAVQGRSR